jgi:hypothetical protein
MGFHREYRQLWVDSGYPGHMGSACAVKPPPKEYIAAYHFASAEHAISNIEHGRIKVAHLSDLNDPFELLGVNFNTNLQLRNPVTQFRNQSNAKMGLLCFSKDWISPALWSHYADRHHGICLGFHAKREMMDEVKYEHDRIAATTDLKNLPITISEDLEKQLKFTKAHDWIYEQEIRRFVKLNETTESNGLHFFPFDDSLKLAEVIIGPHCTLQREPVREQVRRRYRDVAVYNARLAYGYFSIVPTESTIP